MTAATFWADATFAAFGPTRATALYEALAEVLDPNNGGDAADMFRELRDAYQHYLATITERTDQ